MSLQLRKLLVFIVLLILACSKPSTDIAGGASEGELILSGVFVTEAREPVNGANVRIINSVTSTAVDSTSTDSTGYYSFTTLEPGLYTIDAIYTGTDTLVAVVNNIAYDSVYDVGEKIMRVPGAITGEVSFDETDRGGVVCYLEGTSFSAFTTEAGVFTISGIPAGDYELVADLQGALYAKKRYGTVTVISDSLLSIGTITLEYDTAKAPPAPKAVSAAYDSISGIATISWSSVSVADLSGYVLYGTGSDGVAEQISALITDTTYVDSLWKRVYADETKEFSYQLRSQDRDNNLSDLLSPSATVSPRSGPEVTIDTVTDTMLTGAVSDQFVDSVIIGMKTALSDSDKLDSVKNAFTGKKMSSAQLTKITNEFTNDKESIIRYAYPSKLTDSHRIYQTIVDMKQFYSPTAIMEWIVDLAPAFVYESSADGMSDEEFYAVSAAMEILQPMDEEAMLICMVGIKYQHISQVQLDAFLSQIDYSSNKSELAIYGEERLIE